VAELAELAELSGTLSTYRRLVGARIRADWQYRTSFALFLLGQTLAASADVAAVAVIFSNVETLAGWAPYEVVFLYGVSGISFALGDTFVSPVELAAVHIKAGTFDSFLIRPMGPLWQLSAREYALRRLGRLLLPSLALAVALARVEVDWTPARVFLVPMTVVCGAVIFGAVWVVTSSLAFWTVETQEVASSFTYGGNFMTAYPFDVLARWLRRLAIFVVPLASVAYLPGCALFEQPMPFGLPRWSAWSGPAVALAAALVARAVWTFAIRHYRSTGS